MDQFKEETTMNFNPGSKPILTLMNDIENRKNGGLDLRPSYQRNYIWNDSFKDNLIHSVIKGYPIGAITIRNLGNERNRNGSKSEVVDGQQRLTTLYNFYKGDYKIKGKRAKEIVNLIKNILNSDLDYREEKISKKEKYEEITISYNNLPDAIKNNFISFQVATIIIDYADDKNITQYFSFLQNQERLRAGEIINSIPETILEKYYNKLYDIEALLKVLSFNNNRKEFDKIFYSSIGIFDKKIQIGTTDKKILSYASNKKSDLVGETLELVENMITNINLITEKMNLTAKIIANKRYIKFLFLLAGFNLLDFNGDVMFILRKLKKINDKLSVFSSAKENIVENSFIGFEQSEIEEYRLIALIMKGSHVFSRLKERCELLAEKIKNDEKIKI